MKNQLNGDGLKREVGFFSATVLVIANMVGTGIFTTSGYIMTELADPRALLLCWLFGGVFALCGALCYGELGARFPKAGGEYVFLREGFGRPMGFLSGWISLIVGFSAPIAAAAIALANYLYSAFGLEAGAGIALSAFGVELASVNWLKITAIAVIFGFSLVHYHSLSTGSRVQNGLTVFKIVLLLVFVAAGFWVGQGSLEHFSPKQASEGFSMEAFAVSLIFVAFAYSGWNASAYLGGEIQNPRRNIPLSLLVGTAGVICLYMAINALYIYAMPAAQMRDVLDVGAKSAVHLFGDNISRYFSAAVSLGLLSVLSAMIMTGPRVYYAMSRDSIFFPLFARVNRKRHTPAASIFLQAAIAVILVLTSTFDALLIYIGFTLSIFAMLAVVGMIRLRFTRPGETRRVGYKTFGYPFTPLLFILGNLWIVVFSIQRRPMSALFSLLTISAGILLYLYFERGANRLAARASGQKPAGDEGAAENF